MKNLADDILHGKDGLFEALVNASEDAMIVVDSSGRTILKNQRSKDLFRMPISTAEETIDSNPLKWVMGMAKDPSQYGRIIDRNHTTINQEEIELKDGTLLDLNSIPLNGPNGQYYGRAWIFRDVTQRKRAQQALQTSEKRFKALFEQAAVGVALTDAITGQFVDANHRYCEIVGRTLEQLRKTTFVGPTHPLDVAGDLEMTRLLRAGTIREFTREKRYLRSDGSEVFANVTVSAMWPPGDSPDYVISIAQDITERKKLEEQVRQSQKMEAIGTLAGGIAHDFNNILAVIIGYTELAQLTAKDRPKTFEHLESIRRATSRATGLVRQILAFSRKQPLERRATQLPTVVLESMELLRATIPSTIEFALSSETTLPPVLADTTQVHQILMNLATNALHSMGDGVGRLTVKIDSVLAGTNPIDNEYQLKPGLYARVTVKDTGCGMAPDQMSRIFEPFYTTKGPGKGTGLGLAVVHGIMNRHDGAIRVASKVGKGTTFQLFFPAYNLPVVNASESEPQIYRGRGENILLVDDEPDLVALGHNMLVEAGYCVDSTTNPEDALRKIQRDPSRYAVIITDQTMPRMTGLDLAGYVGKIRKDLPVILTSGNGGAMMAERSSAAGIAHLLLKPIPSHTLLATVYDVLRKVA